MRALANLSACTASVRSRTTLSKHFSTTLESAGTSAGSSKRGEGTINDSISPLRPRFKCLKHSRISPAVDPTIDASGPNVCPDVRRKIINLTEPLVGKSSRNHQIDKRMKKFIHSIDLHCSQNITSFRRVAVVKQQLGKRQTELRVTLIRVGPMAASSHSRASPDSLSETQKLAIWKRASACSAPR